MSYFTKNDWNNKNEVKLQLQEYVNKNQKANKKLQLNYWGELKAAIEIFERLDNSSLKVKNIKRHPRSTPDLTVIFNNDKEIGIEVKSSSFKNDYFNDFWMFGVPLKKKDLENKNIGVIAMVNAAYFWKGTKVPRDFDKVYDFVDSKLQLNTKSIILFFNRSDLNEIPLCPLMKIPIPLLLKLKKEDQNKESLGKFLKINENSIEVNHKGIIINGNLIFRVLHKNKDNFNNLGEFPDYFGMKEKCLLIREYHNSMRLFSEKIENNIKKYKDLHSIVSNLQEAGSDIYKQEFMNCPNNCLEFINCQNYLKKSKLSFT